MVKPSLLDWHIYGGAMLVAVGVACAVPWAGLVALGAILLWLGLSRPPKPGSG